MAVMPASMCSSTWQWNIHIPTLSGTISAVTNCAGSKEKMSVRCPPIETTFPCQCGVWIFHCTAQGHHIPAHVISSLHYQSEALLLRELIRG